VSIPVAGKIIFIGKNHDAQKSDYNEIIDLNGKVMLPAFNDNHVHLVKGAMVSSELNLRNVSTSEEFKNEILKYHSIKARKMDSGRIFF
jgi:predicted amidohydrolase YtcJ